jgi:FkbM family methyltransferase
MTLIQKIRRYIYRLLISMPVRWSKAYKVPSVLDANVDINVIQDIPNDLYRCSLTFNQVLLSKFMHVMDGDFLFVDVGVNVGQNLLAHFTQFPQTHYVGFDPNPSAIAVAEMVSLRNGFHPTLICAGLSSSSSRMSLLKQTLTDSACKVQSTVESRSEGKVSTIVQTDSLDSWIETFVTKGPNWFVKIDVEGHELQVLQGMSTTLRTIRPIISCEILGASVVDEIIELQNKAKDIQDLLRKSNYVMYLIDLQHHALSAEYRLMKIDEIPVGLYSEMPGVTDYLFVPVELPVHSINVEVC